jgi:glycosyltransferase involved in cell wall biosynthesis
VRLYVLERPAGPNQNVEALERAGVVVSSPSPWTLRVTRAAVRRRSLIASGLSVALLVSALPLLAATSAVRRHAFRRALGRTRWRLHGWFAERLTFERLLYVALARQLRRLRPDVVHVHGWGCGEDPPGALAWLRRRACTLVYTEHNSPDPRLRPPRANASMNDAHVLIAVSQAGRAGLETVGRATRPIRIIPYGIDPPPHAATAAQPRAEEFVVACLARLVPQKGHADLIDAMAVVRDAIPAARLLLAGTGPLRTELLTRSERLGLGDQVEFLGLVSRGDLTELFAGTDVVVLPSYWEGLPVALIEALSAGKPIVATDVGGNPELVLDGENGLIVPSGDPAALAQALIRLAADPAARCRMGAASAERFRRGEFDPAAVAQQHLAAYRLAAGVREERRVERRMAA